MVKSVLLSSLRAQVCTHNALVEKLNNPVELAIQDATQRELQTAKDRIIEVLEKMIPLDFSESEAQELRDIIALREEGVKKIYP